MPKSAIADRSTKREFLSIKVVVTNEKSAYRREAMLNTFGTVSARRMLGVVLLSGATGLIAVGCGGGDSGPGPSGGAGGETTGDAGETGEAGGSAAGRGGAANGGSGGDAGAIGEGGEGGTVIVTPAKNHSAVSFVNSAAVSTSKNFILVSGLGESVGGTVGSKRSKSLKYTFIPGVVAASTP